MNFKCGDLIQSKIDFFFTYDKAFTIYDLACKIEKNEILMIVSSSWIKERSVINLVLLHESNIKYTGIETMYLNRFFEIL